MSASAVTAVATSPPTSSNSFQQDDSVNKGSAVATAPSIRQMLSNLSLVKTSTDKSLNASQMHTRITLGPLPKEEGRCPVIFFPDPFEK